MKAKEYKLEIEVLRDEGIGDITEMFSKGHHNEKEFKEMCKDVYEDECNNVEESSNDYFIEKLKVCHKYGKKVGCFEDGKRIGWMLDETEKPKKGYFPITTLYF